MNKIIDKCLSCFSQCAKTSLGLVLMCGAFSIILAQTNWILHSSVPTNKGLNCVSGTPGGICFIGGDSGTILGEFYNNFWTKQLSGTTNDLLGIQIGKNPVAVGEAGTIVSEMAGSSWQSRVSNTNRTLRSIAFGGIYIAVGDSGLIMTSSDDSIWTTRVSGTIKNLKAVGYPVGVSYTTGSYTAVGDSGTILTSPNGITWNMQTSGTQKNLNAVASGSLFGGGSIRGIKLVVVGDSGIILTSADSGKTWNSQTSGTTNNLRGLYCATDGLEGVWIYFVSVGEQGTILTSSTNVNYAAYSLPGVKWTSQESGTSRNLYGVSHDYTDSIVAVGDSGTIVTSLFAPFPSVGIRQSKTSNILQLISISSGMVYYTLSELSRTSITLYDPKGRFVKTLIDREQQPGSYRVAMPRDLLPGVYTLTFKAGNQEINKTIIVSR